MLLENLLGNWSVSDVSLFARNNICGEVDDVASAEPAGVDCAVVAAEKAESPNWLCIIWRMYSRASSL